MRGAIKIWLLGQVLAAGCADPPDPTGLPEPLAKHAPAPKVEATPEPTAPPVPSEIGSCEQLAASACLARSG